MKDTVVLKGGAPWGFRLGGGVESGKPLSIAKLNPNSKAYQEGLAIGDLVRSINGHNCGGLLLTDAQQLIRQATHQLIIEIDRLVPLRNGDVIHQSTTTINLKSREIPVINVKSDITNDNSAPKSPTVHNIPVITSSDCKKTVRKGDGMYPRKDPMSHWSRTSTLGRPKLSGRPPAIASEVNRSNTTLPHSKASKGLSLFLKQQEKLSQLSENPSETDVKKSSFDDHSHVMRRRPVPKHAGYFSEDEGEGFIERRPLWHPPPQRVNRIGSVDSAPKFMHFSPDNRKPVPVITVKGIKRADDQEKQFIQDDVFSKKTENLPQSAPPMADKTFNLYLKQNESTKKSDSYMKYPVSQGHDKVEKTLKASDEDPELELEKILATLERRKPVEPKYLNEEHIPTEKVVPIQISTKYRSDGKVSMPDSKTHVPVPVHHDTTSARGPHDHKLTNRSMSSPGQASTPRKELFSSSFSSPYFEGPNHSRESSSSHSVEEKVTPQRFQNISADPNQLDQQRQESAAVKNSVFQVPIIVGKQEQRTPVAPPPPQPRSAGVAVQKSPEFSGGLLKTVDVPTFQYSDADERSHSVATSSPKPGIWSPGAQTNRAPSEMVERRSESSSDVTQNRIPVVWSPANTLGPTKKEFRSVKLDTQVPKRVEVSKETLPKRQEEPSVADNVFRQQEQHDYYYKDKHTKNFSYEPLDTTNHVPETQPQSHEDLEELPSTQSPYVTLLQKTRDPEDVSPTTSSSLPNDGQLPQGVQYLGSTTSVDGDVKHTDTLYALPTQGDVTSTKTVVERAGKIQDGIGPIDEEGVPLAFRKDVDEKNQHDWYKQMYRSLHRHARKGSMDSMIDSYKPTYMFPEDDPHTDTKKVEPTKVKPEISKTEEDIRKAEERTKKVRERLANNDLKNKWQPAHARHSNEPYRIQPRSIVDYEPGFSSIAFNEARTDVTLNPPIPKPAQFSQYKTNVPKPSGQVSAPTEDYITSYKNVQKGGDIPVRGFQKPAPDKPRVTPHNRISPPKTEPHNQTAIENVIDVIKRTSPAKIRHIPRHKPVSQDNVKRVGFNNEKTDINGNDKRWLPPHKSDDKIQSEKNQSPKTNLVNGGYHYPESDPQRNQLNAEKQRQRRDEDYAYRMRRLDEIYEEDRRRTSQEGQTKNDLHRHHDYFTPAQKSPIPSDRFDIVETKKVPPSTAPKLTVPAERRRGFQIKGKARALYNFTAQNPNELTFRKGEIIYLHRQIDQNWYEGEKHGTVGILPANYIEILTSIDKAKSAAIQAEGQARAKYQFKAQTSVELDLCKGDTIVLLRHVDENWYEGRNGNRQGIFPCSYVEVIREPSTPLVTPAPSVINTPMIGTPESLSPVGFEAPTPPPQPSPSSFVQRPSSAPTYNQAPRTTAALDDKFPGYIPITKYTGPSIDQYTDRRTDPMTRSFSQPGQAQQKTVGGFAKPMPIKSEPVKPKVADDDLALTRYRALYTYHRQNEDELELLEGDEVYVMEKCDDGWYVGTSARTGDFGTFPGNYVHVFT